MDINTLQLLDMRRKNRLAGAALMFASVMGILAQFALGNPWPLKIMMLVSTSIVVGLMVLNRRQVAVTLFPYAGLVLMGAVVAVFLFRSASMSNLMMLYMLVATGSIYLRRGIMLIYFGTGFLIYGAFFWYHQGDPMLDGSARTVIIHLMTYTVVSVILFLKEKIASQMFADIDESRSATEELLRLEKEREERLRASSAALSANIERIFGKNGTNAESMKEINQGFQEIASGVTVQAQTISDITEELEETNRMVARMVEQSDMLEQKAAESEQASQHGSERVEALSSAMQQFSGSFEIMHQEMSNLQASIAEVTHSIRSINDISAQTNILSLNASIEAARAGEAGRGFAIVAQEVRSLAAQSTTLADEMMSKIGKIQSDTRSVQELMSRNVDQMTQSVEMTDQTRGTFRTIEAAVGILTENIKSNHEQTQSIGRKSAHVKTATADFAAFIEELSATLDQLSATVGEQSANQQEITTDIRESRGEVQHLMSLYQAKKDAAS
ncbi:methyl-accepting chemotaxis protein [Paenibacillus methanolicus]|uniref:Methyl-accepting chemotaxis protein (MCP) signaling protein n=1 Tax=Paenibacillus methanolicus TaxID=582686 RepID=A0A5S5CAW1_9BACL|nr:methyl-accepting chemotaxis protein [Paenibacillus methanolicus]TYP75506.1 methyl-accepting chemotaxis protein (MCP) signaling protein [Paenibacillus methanolicus]